MSTRAADHLAIAGVTPISTLDYPDHLACVIFTQGCPMRCGYCHNPQMISRQQTPDAPRWSDLRVFLEERAGLLQAVVFSGGEPTLQSALLAAVREAFTLGYKIALHTSGVYPQRLKPLLPYLSWVGMDIKALPEDYDQVCGRRGLYQGVEQSLELLLQSKVAQEVRITLHPNDFNLAKLALLLEQLQEMGVRHCAIQLARGGQCLDPAYRELSNPFDPEQLQTLINHLCMGFSRLELRTG
ncbi:anaerobic ribonucleoside-triphosphate reductase activating protein [Nitrincola sp. MINF-07-Sa-05]|uniref:anaerobic ribonucleoside-triphosphate reductase activating protein n=1 Tax=Nitrincola salilacus TaxID=3400273 RepID=UPI003917FD25